MSMSMSMVAALVYVVLTLVSHQRTVEAAPSPQDATSIQTQAQGISAAAVETFQADTASSPNGTSNSVAGSTLYLQQLTYGGLSAVVYDYGGGTVQEIAMEDFASGDTEATSANGFIANSSSIGQSQYEIIQLHKENAKQIGTPISDVETQGSGETFAASSATAAGSGTAGASSSIVTGASFINYPSGTNSTVPDAIDGFASAGFTELITNVSATATGQVAATDVGVQEFALSTGQTQTLDVVDR